MPLVPVRVPLHVSEPTGPLRLPEFARLNVAVSVPPETLIVGENVPDLVNEPVNGQFDP